MVEGLYSIRGDVAPLADIVSVCRAHGAYLLVDEAHSLGTYGKRGLGCAEAQGVLDQVDFVVGTFSKSLAGIGGVCVSDHAELRALHFLSRAYVFTASGSPSNIASVSAALRVVRAHPELRDRLWANIRSTVEDFLLVLWRDGALLGEKPEQAYFVRCDRTTMTQNDLDNGRLICLIGIAPVKPAEFVIFRIGQWTADSKMTPTQ